MSLFIHHRYYQQGGGFMGKLSIYAVTVLVAMSLILGSASLCFAVAPKIISPIPQTTFSSPLFIQGEDDNVGGNVQVAMVFEFGGPIGQQPNWSEQKILGESPTYCSKQLWVAGMITPLVLFHPGQWRFHAQYYGSSEWSDWVQFNVSPVLNPAPPVIITPASDLVLLDNEPTEITAQIRSNNPDYDEIHHDLVMKFQWRQDAQSLWEDMPIGMYSTSKYGDIITGKITFFKWGEWRFAARSDFEGAQFSNWRTIKFCPPLKPNKPPIILTPAEGKSFLMSAPADIEIKVEDISKYKIVTKCEFRKDNKSPWKGVLLGVSNLSKSGNTWTGVLHLPWNGQWRVAAAEDFHNAPWSAWRSFGVYQFVKISPIELK